MSPGINIGVDLSRVIVPARSLSGEEAAHASEMSVALRDARSALRMSSEDAAQAIGISALELARLEAGKSAYADPEQWDRSIEELRGAAIKTSR